MKCDARIRPFTDGTELQCEKEDVEHLEHKAILADYAWEGSETIMQWFEADRRNFHGDWPGACDRTPGCILPAGHRRGCST